MDRTIIDDARQTVSNLFGEKMAAKASAAFCLAFGQPTSRLFAAAVEAAPGLPQSQSIVVEFVPQPEAIVKTLEAIDKLRQTRAWTSLRSAIKKTIKDAPVPDEEVPLQAGHLLRQAKIVAARNNFYQTAGAIRNEIERLARGFFRPGPETTASPQFPSSVTEVCWLNRSVRTYTNPRALADLVADKNIERIDLPRRLQADIDVSGKTVGAVQFRKKSKRSGKGVIVAVIDQEAALSHPALTNRVIHRMNFSREPWGTPGPHATAVAGIIGSDDTAFTGMAPDAVIHNYKVLATNSFLNGDDFDGALGIQQALEDGAHIANCSWGAGPAGDGTSREARACDNAWSLGLAVVKSAGNNGPGPSTLTTPADADGVIVVGATDREGLAVQDYSSRGPANGKSRPHLVAPGGTEIHGINSCLMGGGFGDCGHGTSFAAPHVSGLLALILEGEPDLTPDQLRDKLLRLCTAFPGVDVNTQGAGSVSLAGLL